VVKPETSQWRDQQSYDYVDALTTEGLAWEYLRRSPDYQQQYNTLVAKGLDNASFDLAAQRRWGLRFPGATGPFRSGAIGILVKRSRSGRSYSCCGFRI